ncbi:putative phage tail assembly chaperone [Pseudomonas sp. H1h]|uniref:putative phage tail assembly chaperone n=1 Tax=Pseudomonas sp. H1h TaxID=1397280 RepID=UPI00046A2373|nr:putative phage tail assembly chaperone [Pseudomonas sp. H1h]
MSEVNRSITLEMGNLEFTFSLTPQDVTKYFNATTQANKVAPAHNLLMGTVKQEDKTALKQLLENPVTTMTMAGALLEEYSPDVQVIVKKPSPTPKA